MSHLDRKRYKKFLQPSSDSLNVPRTTRWRIEKRKRTDAESGEVSCEPSTSTVNPQALFSEDDFDPSDSPLMSSSSSDSSAESSNDSSGSSTESSSDDVEDNPRPKVDYSAKYGLDDPLPSTTSGLTKFEVLLLILHFAMRFGLSNVAIKALIRLVNVILGRQIIPNSDYIFHKVFSSSIPVQYHLFCPNCGLYLGNPKKFLGTNCPECQEEISAKKSASMRNFFLTMSIEEQIKQKLERDGNDIINYRKSRQKDEDHVSDVFDGMLFRDLADTNGLSDNDITINFNTDGAPIHENSSDSLWPIQFRLNEIDPTERFSAENLMLAGVWLGHPTINMILFLAPFVKELKTLATSGIRWYNKVTEQFVTTRVFLLHCIVDTIAKAKVLNIKQFNGYNSCYTCQHSGTPCDNQVRFDAGDYEERSDRSIRADMMTAFESDQTTRGLKGISALVALPFFQFPHAVVIDYMHSHLLGVCKQLFTKIYMNSSFHASPFYLSREKIRLIDKRFLKLQPPSDISRDVRPLSDCNNWKANEWRSWVFYYGPIVLQGVLPQPFFKHFCLLSSALYILNQRSIPRCDLPVAKEYLNSFVSQCSQLYGIQCMTSNIHLSTHLVKGVIMNGPLWAYSAFVYESGNGYLVKLVHGTNGATQQIARKFLTFCSLPQTISEQLPLKELILDFCENLMNFPHFKKFSAANDVIIVGNRLKSPLVPSPEESLLLQQKQIDPDTIFEVKKVVFSSSIFSHHTDKKIKRNDSMVKLLNNGYARIEKMFFSTNDASIIYAFVTPIKLNSHSVNLPNVNFRMQMQTFEQYAYGNLSIIENP